MYNTENKSSSVTLSEGSLMNLDKTQEENSCDSLEKELCLTAMLFAVSDDNDDLAEVDTNWENDYNDDDDIDDVGTITKLNASEKSLEEAMEAEGLLYVGGYIAHKFSQ